MLKYFKNLFTKKPKTKMVKSKNGMNVELHTDWPAEMANVICDCFEQGGMVSGTVDESGKIKIRRHKK